MPPRCAQLVALLALSAHACNKDQWLSMGGLTPDDASAASGDALRPPPIADPEAVATPPDVAPTTATTDRAPDAGSAVDVATASAAPVVGPAPACTPTYVYVPRYVPIDRNAFSAQAASTAVSPAEASGADLPTFGAGGVLTPASPAFSGTVSSDPGSSPSAIVGPVGPFTAGGGVSAMHLTP